MIEKKDYLKFAGQALVQSGAKIGTTLAGLPIVAVGLFFAENPKTHPFYPEVSYTHAQTYLEKGSSGTWRYEQLPDWAIMQPYRNLNYGLQGEPSGRWSAKRGGKERSFWSKWLQCAIRNPSNGFRYMDAFSCQVDNLDIEYLGDAGPLDIQPKLVPGWNFVKGMDRDTGKVYYSFQYIRGVGKTRGFKIRLGFKVEPSHIAEGDRPESRERATFTGRLGFKTIDAF